MLLNEIVITSGAIKFVYVNLSSFVNKARGDFVDRVQLFATRKMICLGKHGQLSQTRVQHAQ